MTAGSRIASKAEAMPETGDRWFPLVAGVLVAGLLVAAGVYVNRVGATGETLLSSLDGPFEFLVDSGGRWYHGFKHASDLLRLVVLFASLGWIARLERIAERSPSRLVAAIVVAWVAQSYLMDGYRLVGAGLYLVSLVAYLRSTAPVEESPVMLSRGVELALLSVLLAFFTLAALHQLDVMPKIYLDEVAYYAASRMQLGELPQGNTWAYTFERFQGQPVPFWIFTAFVGLLPPGVLAIRFAAVASCTIALLVAVLAYRRHVGSATTLWMVALAGISPIYLAFSRAGFYVAVSILHSTACVAALLWFHDRRNFPSAVVLGAVLGASAFAYQVSWFVPVLVAATFLISPREWITRDTRRPLAITIAVAIAAILVGAIYYPTGIREISRQTFDKAAWNRGKTMEWNSGFIQALAPESLTTQQVSEFIRRIEGDEVTLNPTTSSSGRTVLGMNGSSSALREVRRELDGASWEILKDSTAGTSIWRNARKAIARLFYAPRFQNFVRLSDEPVLGPLCAALLAFGIVEALRRRRSVAMRVLLVWAVGGILLPTAIAGAYPRRMVLALPFMQLLMALPIVEIQRSIQPAASRVRKIGWLALIVLYVIAAAMGSHLLARHWDVTVAVERTSGSKAELINAIEALPSDETVLLWPFYPRFVQLLARAADEPPSGSPQRVFSIARAKKNPSAMRKKTCEHALPLSWILPTNDAVISRFENVLRDFRYSTSKTEFYTVIRIEEEKPGACPGRSPADVP